MLYFPSSKPYESIALQKAKAYIGTFNEKLSLSSLIQTLAFTLSQSANMQKSINMRFNKIIWWGVRVRTKCV